MEGSHPRIRTVSLVVMDYGYPAWARPLHQERTEAEAEAEVREGTISTAAYSAPSSMVTELAVAEVEVAQVGVGASLVSQAHPEVGPSGSSRSTRASS